MTGTPEYGANLRIQELGLETQLDKIATNAIETRLPLFKSTVRSDVTKEMILDYQNEMSKPLEIDGKKYLYHPSTLDIDREEPDLRDVMDEREIADAERSKQTFLFDIEQKLPNDIRELEDSKEEIIRTLEIEVDDAIQKGDGKLAESLSIRYRRDIQKVEDRIEQKIRELINAESQIEIINSILEETATRKKENEDELYRVETVNKQRLKNYEEDLNLLNRGRFNIQRQPNETDDEYRNRLRDTGVMTGDDDAINNSAELYNREKLKERMSELSKNGVITGTAMKYFDRDEIFEINKQWTTIKRNFIKAFGFNNQSLTDKDIVEFLKIEINPTLVRAEIPAREGGSELAGGTEIEPSAYPYLSYEEAKSKRVPELEAYVKEVAPKLVKEFKSAKGQSNKVEYLRTNGLLKPSSGAIESYFRPSEGAAETLSGFGIKPITHNLPTNVAFGRIMISPKKLYYNNVLSVRHKSGKTFSGIPNVSVSDKFVSIIMGLLKGDKPSLKDFSALDKNEKSMYDSLTYMAGLQREVDNNFNETKHELKKRLELLEGEITGGNNNPALKKELQNLLSKMVKTGMVGGGDAKRYYKSVIGRF